MSSRSRDVGLDPSRYQRTRRGGERATRREKDGEMGKGKIERHRGEKKWDVREKVTFGGGLVSTGQSPSLTVLNIS